MALRWKKNPSPTGLARIGAGHPGYTLSDGTIRFAIVYSLSKGTGWYWVAGWESGIHRKNTCNEPVQESDIAKASAMSYVKQCLASAKQAESV